MTRPAFLGALYGAGEGIPRRLKRLWKHGYLDRPEAQRIWRMRTGGGSKPLVYALANRGARALVKRGIDGAGKRDWTERNRDLSPSSSKLPHELAVADVLVAFRRACAARPALRFLSREEPTSKTALAIPSGRPLYPDGTFRAPARRSHRARSICFSSSWIVAVSRTRGADRRIWRASSESFRPISPMPDRGGRSSSSASETSACSRSRRAGKRRSRTSRRRRKKCAAAWAAGVFSPPAFRQSARAILSRFFGGRRRARR